ncbi:hypothetical protein V2J09_022412 [Rumex salicifolius]
MAMEVFNGVIMRTRPGLYSGAGVDSWPRVYVSESSRVTCKLNHRESKFCARSLRRRVVREIFAFEDKRHMEYYNCCTQERKEDKKKKEKKKEKGGWNGVSEKKRAKLVKDLAKNLNMLSELGFGLETDEDKNKTISEAALVLQAHLEHLREEGKKLKKKGEMAILEAQRMNTVMDDSSSSSESSDNECDNDGAVNMSILCNKMEAEQIVLESVRSEGHETMATPPASFAVLEHPCPKAEAKAIEDVSSPLKRIEVCMGGKCKKAGGPVLMEEFQKVLGVGGSVVGCKCMGKCKTAPNVRFFNAGEEEDEDDSVRSPRNPLFLGVGLDDVGFIVANYFGSEQRQAGVGVSLDSAGLS